MTNTLHARRQAATIDQIRRARGGRRRHRPRLLPRRRSRPRPRSKQIVTEPPTSRSSRTSTSTTSAASRPPRPAPPACASIPGNIGRARPRASRKSSRRPATTSCSIRIGVNAGSLEREPAGEVRRALPRRDGRECARATCPFLQDHDFHEFKISLQGLRRLPGRRRLPPAGRGHATARCTSASPRPARLRTGTVKSAIGLGSAALGRHRRHHPRERWRPSRSRRSRPASTCSSRSACATAASTSSPARPARARGTT
jgi:hypothetical protein